MNKRLLFAILGVIIVVLGAVFVLSLPELKSNYSGGVETVTIGATAIEGNALIYIADERRFFTTNGVRVVFKDYDTGVAAVNGLLKGDVDIALTMEFVIVGKSLQKQDVLSLGTIDKSMIFYILARTDRGIKTITDLRGKKIGVPRHTIMEFYLGRMLELNGLSIKQVTMVETKASDPAGALAGGEVDAVITWEPYVTQIRKQMGSGVFIWPVQSGQVSFWSIVSTPGWINQHTNLVRQLLKSLAQAELYIPRHLNEAKAIIKKRLKYDDPYLAAIWAEHEFFLSLDQALVAAMEDEARWMIKNNLTNAKQVPDFMNYIYVDGLKAVRPESVNIAR